MRREEDTLRNDCVGGENGGDRRWRLQFREQREREEVTLGEMKNRAGESVKNYFNLHSGDRLHISTPLS